MALEIQVLAQWIWFLGFPPHDNSVSNANTEINNEKPAQIRFHSKRQHTITKMNNNINMDSTIGGYVNAHS
jgi:hypothetical protein